jgi:hypothetical protein
VRGQQLKFTQRRRRTRGAIVDADLSTPLQLDVMDAGDAGAVVSWRAGTATVHEVSPQLRASMTVAAASPGVPLVIQLDTRGCVQALLNVDEVCEGYAAFIDRLAGSLPAEPDQRALVEQMLAGLKQVFEDERAAAAMSLREPQMLFSACGRRYGVGEPVQFDTVLQNPFGGPPIQALARFSIRKVDPRRGEAELGWLMVSNEGDTTASADASVQRLAAPLGGPGSFPAMPKVQLQERGDYRVDLRTAWPRWVRHVREASAGDAASADMTSFELQGG